MTKHDYLFVGHILVAVLFFLVGGLAYASESYLLAAINGLLCVMNLMGAYRVAHRWGVH